MDSLEMWHRDSTLGETSRELNRTVLAANPILYTPDYSIPFTPMEHGETVFEENPILYYPYRSDSVKVQYTIRNGSYDILPSSCEKIMAVGYPSCVEENIFEGHGFVGEFNPKYGMSNWVSECLTRDQMNGIYIDKKYNKSHLFYEDKDVYFERIWTSDDYGRSRKHPDESKRLARGHLAAAGNHGYNFVAYMNTFCFKNIAPMYDGVNQILGNIEEQGQGFADEFNELYSITGPVFYAEREPVFITEGSKLRVPDAFFKVLAHKADKKCKNVPHKYYKICKVYGYLVNNYPNNHEETKKVRKNIDKARRRLSFINKATGLNILGNVTERKVDDLFKDQRTPSNRDNRTG